MNLREFCKRYNIGLGTVMEITGVSDTDLIKYNRGNKKVSKEAADKIDIFIKVVTDNNLVNSYDPDEPWYDRRTKFVKYKDKIRSLMEESYMGDKKIS